MREFYLAMAGVTGLFVLCADAATISVSVGDDIQAAVAAAGVDGEVVLGAGTYALTETVTVANGVTVKGADGVIITAEAPDFQLFALTGGARIDNLTFSGITGFTVDRLVALSNGTVENCRFTSNTTTARLYLIQGNANTANNVVKGCVFSSNTVGGIFKSGVFRDNEVVENTVRDYSGCCGSANAYRCKFVRNNRAGSANIAMNSTLYDCLIAGNTKAGGENLLRGSSTYNCTIVNNAVGNGIRGGSHYNDIILGSDSKNVWDNGKLYNCLIDEGYTCTTVNPLVTDGAGVLDNDWTLPEGSPAIEAGVSSGTYFPNTDLREIDLAGNPRIVGKTIDLGCYEVQDFGALDIAVSVAGNESRTLVLDEASGNQVSYSAVIFAKTGASVEVVWDYGDGASWSQTVVVASSEHTISASHVYTVGGAFNLTVTATVRSGEESATSADTLFSAVAISDRASSVIYVATDGYDGNRGNTRASAKRTIDTAVVAAGAGGRVCVLPGTYKIEQKITFPENLTVTGLGETRADVVLTADSGANFTFFELTSAGNVLSNMTFKDILNLDATPLISMRAAAVIDNCAFINITSTKGGDFTLVSATSGTPAFMVRRSYFADNAVGNVLDLNNSTASTVTDCVFERNQCTNYGGVCRRGSLYRCKILDNDSTKAPTMVCTLYDCLFAGNIKHSEASAMRQGISYNCTFLGNNGQLFYEGTTHYNAVICGSLDGSVETTVAGTTVFKHCLFDREIAAGTQDDCVVSDNLRLREDGRPKGGSAVVNGGIAYKVTDGIVDKTQFNTTYFPNADKRDTDLAGNPRIKGANIDYGCYEFYASPLTFVVR